MSPDPPGNHKGTAAAQARDVPVGGPFAGQGGPEFEEFFNHLAARSPRWLLTEGQRKRLTPSVIKALAARWTPDELARLVGASSSGSRNPSPCSWPGSSRRTAAAAQPAAALVWRVRRTTRECWTSTATRRGRARAAKRRGGSSDALQRPKSPDDTCGTRTGIPSMPAGPERGHPARRQCPVEPLTLQETEGDKKLRTELGA